MDTHTQSYDCGYGYSSGYQERRRKTDWAGVSLGDAFKPNLDYHLRLAAQRRFYQLVKKVQFAAARQAGHVGDSFEAEVKPQISPFYTSYPSAIAAYAAAGLTGYLEYETRVPEKILFATLTPYLENPAQHDGVRVDQEVYRKMAHIVTACVQTRLLLEDLSRVPAMAPVELYRLFSASQQDSTFPSVPAILNAVILYGDILPDWRAQNLHPVTRMILLDVSRACHPFFEQLGRVRPEKMLMLGAAWVRAVCRCLAPYLPDSRPADDPVAGQDSPSDERGHSGVAAQPKLSPEPAEPSPTDRIRPLGEPSPPALFDPPGPAQQMAQALREAEADRSKRGKGGVGAPELDDPTRKLLASFEMALNKAGGQHSEYEDMRSDILEKVLRGADFQRSPIEGSPVDGHEVTVPLGDNQAAGGEIFDRPVELSDDVRAYEKLKAEAQPIADALRRTLYPNVKQVPKTVRLRTSGALDPARLALADVSQAIFKRYRIEERADRRGKPVLLIACDGSGSLNPRQMRMTKVLAAAWLNSTARSEVQVLAGLYHSGRVRRGVSGPLVQWMYHPRKTPAVGRADAARALVSLPNKGTGVQADALSLAFMLEEARRIARGRMIYLILISDCEWNRCLHTKKSGAEEVRAFFESAYENGGDKLHTTLVALGVEGETGFEDILEKVIAVSDDRLTDYAAVAGQIGLYVASCMRERRKLINKR